MNHDAECLSYLTRLPISGVTTEEHRAAHPLASAIPAVASAGAALREVLARLDGREGVTLQEIARYRAEPGDVVIAHVPGRLDQKTRETMIAELGRVFRVPVLVVDGGIGIEVLNEAEVPVAAPQNGVAP